MTEVKRIVRQPLYKITEGYKVVKVEVYQPGMNTPVVTHDLTIREARDLANKITASMIKLRKKNGRV